MLFGYREKATGSSWTPIPNWTNAGSPHWHPAIQYLTCMPERRRIVAQVRRYALKYRRFFASQNNPSDATIC
jgi:hypothetical protein